MHTLHLISIIFFGSIYMLDVLLVTIAATLFHTDPPVVEICDNAIDDDGDGLIDLNDPECLCPVIEPISLIPNPSFEEMNCCPDNRSQLDCAETWIQASEATTDYIHTCGWLGWAEFPAPQPFPDGEGIVGFRDGRVVQGGPEPGWKEYAGACLLSPLKAGFDYRFEFHVGFTNPTNSPPINVTFFGTTDCSNLPFGTGESFFGCPTNGPGWMRLGSVYATGPGWVKLGLNITPAEDITAIAIGPDCQATSATVSTYYFFDNLVLADARSFDFRISEVSHPCSQDFTLEVPPDPRLEFQWYKDGIALVGETAARLSANHGEGRYQVRFTGDNLCNITQAYDHRIPVYSNAFETYICEGEVMAFGSRQIDLPGTYTETFKTADNCDSMVTIDLNVLGLQTESVSARIFEGEHYAVGPVRIADEGQHLVSLESSLGCDSLVTLNLSYYRVFFPNIFSPNGDGRNDIFSIHGGPDLLEISALRIFNRWGGTVYEGLHQLPGDSQGWNGRYEGQMQDPGVYMYVVDLLMEDGHTRQFAGSVVLMR